jgi:hypothetical protein
LRRISGDVESYRSQYRLNYSEIGVLALKLRENAFFLLDAVSRYRKQPLKLVAVGQPFAHTKRILSHYRLLTGHQGIEP